MGSIKFSPEGGTFEGKAHVHIKILSSGNWYDAESCSFPVFYTLDGSEITWRQEDPNPGDENKLPTKLIVTHGIPYTGPIDITETSTLKAKKFGWVIVWTAEEYSDKYTIIPMAAPTFSLPGGTYNNDQTNSISFSRMSSFRVWIEAQVEDYKIFWTKDGSVPSQQSSLYSSPLALPFSQQPKTNLQAVAILPAPFGPPIYRSAVTSQTYEFKVATPVLTPEGGKYDNAPVRVSMTCGTEGARIRCTPYGGDLGQFSGADYTGPIEIKKPTTVKAQASKDSYSDSDIKSETYWFRVAKPVIQPPSGEYGNIVTVSMSCNTKDAKITYKIGSVTKTYAGPFQVFPTTGFPVTVTAKASKEDFDDSSTASETYTLGTAGQLKPPTTTGMAPSTSSDSATATTTQSGPAIRTPRPVTVSVLKHDGSTQPFSQSKLVTSAVRAGASQQQAALLAKRIAYRIGDKPTVTTTQLSSMVARSLSKVNTAASKNYTAYRDQKNALHRKQ